MNPRPLYTADAQEWVRLRSALWPHADPFVLAREVYQFLFARSSATLPTLHAVFVCPREAGGLCGMVELSLRPYASGCVTSPVGYVEGWYVDADHRQRGIGRQLITAGEGWARAQGCTEMASDIEASNKHSLLAHQRLGYDEIARLVHMRKALE